MSVFDPNRLAALRGALDDGLRRSRRFQNARFTARLDAGGEQITIALADGRGRIEPGAAGPADFTLRGPASAWSGYLSGDGKVEHASIFSMLSNSAISGGVLKSELTSEGDFARLFANFPILDGLLEAAAKPHGGA